MVFDLLFRIEIKNNNFNFLNDYTVKLSKVRRLPDRTEANQIKYEFVTKNRIRTFLLFLCFFFKKFSSVRSKWTLKINWIWCIQVMKILNYVQLIDLIRSNRTELFTKNHKKNQKIRKSSDTVRRDKIELVRLCSVRKFIKVR